MFDCYSPNIQQQVKPKKKTITLMQNGHPQKRLILQINAKKGISKQQIFRHIQKVWNQPNNSHNNQHNSSHSNSNSSVGTYQENSQILTINDNNANFSIKNIRIFSIQAVQYFDQDLQYIKNGDRLYISRGEDYDSNRNFGEYEIVKKLGEGGFGSVDLVKNIVTNEYAAIKVVKPDNNTSSSDIDMIFKQAENLKALNHPNIVKILNCYALKDMRVVIVMEYLQGGQLKKLLQNQKLGYFEQKQAKVYFKQIISGVAYCHRQGIIHRDLKLQNILFKNVIQTQRQKQRRQQQQQDFIETSNNKKQARILKIADFGISGVADRFNPEVDWGTLRYMSPQVLSGKTKLNSPYVDVWACGVILYLLVTGKYPFDGGSSSQIMDNIIKKPLQFPPNILLTIKCKDLIKQMLQKSPSKRINMSDIQDHSWINQNLTAMLILDKQKNAQHSQPVNIKTVGSQQFISHFNKDLGKINYQEYDLDDLRKMGSAELMSTKNKGAKSIGEKRFRDLNRKQIKNKNYIQRKSINSNLIKPSAYQQIKIPKRLQKQRDQIFQELRNYKQHHKEKEKEKQKQHNKEKEKQHHREYDKDKRKTIVVVNGIAQQKDKKMLPAINNKRLSKFINPIPPLLEKSSIKKQRYVIDSLNNYPQKINNEIQYKQVKS